MHQKGFAPPVRFPFCSVPLPTHTRTHLVGGQKGIIDDPRSIFHHLVYPPAVLQRLISTTEIANKKRGTKQRFLNALFLSCQQGGEGRKQSTLRNQHLTAGPVPFSAYRDDTHDKGRERKAMFNVRNMTHTHTYKRHSTVRLPGAVQYY